MIAARTAQFWRSRLSGRRPAAFVAALVVYIIVVLAATPEAQGQAFTPSASGGPAPIRNSPSGSEIDLLVGRSTILNVGTAIARVSLTVPDVADAMVTAPTQLLIHGKQPGIISLFVWDKAGAIKTYEVNVRRDLTALKEHLRTLFPAESITVLGSGKDIVLSGTVAGQYVVDKAAEVAKGYVDKADDVVNLLKQQEGVASNQVMLRVRFAEVSRSALQELGASFFANGYKSEWFGRTQPPGVPAPEFDDGKLTFSDFLNVFVFNAEEGLGGAVRALQNKGLFQSLAEPNLIATNGKEASFLAGGEYPYPVVQSGGGGNAVTIMFKEFGVRLHFTPTVLGGDLINLKVRPEVSSLDFANAVTIDGFRVPALATRRTETEVELRDGQTFAIAGLMNNTLTSSMSKIPGIGDIPILGLLFRSKAHQKNQTELVVMITPTIIRRGQMGVSEGLPSLVEPYLGPPNKTYPNPDAYIGSPRYPVNQGPRGGDNNNNNNNETQAAAQPPATPEPVPARPIVAEQPASSAQPPAARTTTPDEQAPRHIDMKTPPPTPVQPSSMPVAMPMRPASTSASQTSADPGEKNDEEAEPEPAPLTKAQVKALEKAREEQRKAEEAAEKARREEEKREAKRAEAERRRAEKLEKERAKREAEIARRNAELAQKKAEEDEKRERALAEAAERLKAAQAAYQAQLAKSKGGGSDKQ